MKNFDLNKYIIENEIQSTLFVIQTNKRGLIDCKTKKLIRQVMNKHANIRFVVFNNKLPKVNDVYDLLIACCKFNLIGQVKKEYKFNYFMHLTKNGQMTTSNVIHDLDVDKLNKKLNSNLNTIFELQRSTNKISKGKKIGKAFGTYFGIALTSLIMLFPSLIMTTQLAQYKPDPILPIEIYDNKTNKIELGKSYSALSANTGFGAYNHNMHFYMDGINQNIIGGQGTAESKEAVQASLNGYNRIFSADHDTKMIIDDAKEISAKDLVGSRIYKTTYDEDGTPTDSFVNDINVFNNDLNSSQDGLFDFIGLQEQDRTCPKTYDIDQFEYLKNSYIYGTKESHQAQQIKEIYSTNFAFNFATPFIPIPLNDIFGKSHAGLSTFAKFNASEAYRYSLSNITEFPFNMFELKRCMDVTYYPIQGDETHQFVFVNTHLAAYDKGGKIRRAQLKELNDFLKQERDKGNYFIVAADWNQILPGTYGYEGNDAHDAYLDEQYKNDMPIAGWDYEKIKAGANFKSPDLQKDYVHAEQFNPDKFYKKGDLVWCEDSNDTTPDVNHDGKQTDDKYGKHGDLTKYMQNNKRHNYIAKIDGPGPIWMINGEGKYVKSQNWRYSMDSNPVYQDASLNAKIRNELLPISYNENPDYCANFYTTHAIPTLRSAGASFKNESIEGTGHTYKASIDGFLVSNNIKVNFTFGFDTEFKYSDHNPVGISFELIQE